MSQQLLRIAPTSSIQTTQGNSHNEETNVTNNIDEVKLKIYLSPLQICDAHNGTHPLLMKIYFTKRLPDMRHFRFHFYGILSILGWILAKPQRSVQSRDNVALEGWRRKPALKI